MRNGAQEGEKAKKINTNMKVRGREERERERMEENIRAEMSCNVHSALQ